MAVWTPRDEQEWWQSKTNSILGLGRGGSCKLVFYTLALPYHDWHSPNLTTNIFFYGCHRTCSMFAACAERLGEGRVLDSPAKLLWGLHGSSFCKSLLGMEGNQVLHGERGEVVFLPQYRLLQEVPSAVTTYIETLWRKRFHPPPRTFFHAGDY